MTETSDERGPAGARWLTGAVALAFAGALLTASTLYPTYRAPDEPAHVDQVRAVRASWSLPGLGERQLSAQVVASYPRVGYRSGVPGEAPPLSAADAPPRQERPSFAGIAGDEPTTLGNQMAQHPPLYYLLAAGWLTLVDLVGPVAFDLEVWWLRLLGVLLVAPLPWLAGRTARSAGGGPVVAAGAAVAVLAVPMLVHIGSAVNNDALLVALAGVATLHAAAVAGGDLSTRRAVLAGVAIGGAMLTKLFGLALLPLAVLAPAIAWSRRRHDAGTDTGARPALRSAATATVTAVAVGGWWWLRNVAVHGTVQPGGAPSPPPPEGFAPDPGWWVPFALARLVRRWWIEPDTVARSTPPLIVAATVVALLLLVAAFVRRRRGAVGPAGRGGHAGRGAGRRELALLLVPAAGCLVVVVVGAWRAYARTGIPFALHGRYLYPGLVGLAVLAAVGAAALLRERAPLLLLAGAVVVQLTAAWWVLTFYWGVADTTAPLASLRAWVAWSPLPPAATLLPAAAAGAGALAAGVLAWRLARLRLAR